MMNACPLHSVDSPEVLERIREGLPLVEMICHQLRRQLSLTVRMDDLVSYGREGLLTAARSFDGTRGVPFRRWANIRVRGAVIDGIRASSTIPRSVYMRLHAIADDDQTAPDAETLRRRAEEADRRIGEYLSEAATAIVIGFNGATADQHGEPVDGAPSVEATLLREELFGTIRQAISELPDVERTLVRRHYFDGVTFEQAAAELGLSKSWASRLHSRAVEAVNRRIRRASWN